MELTGVKGISAWFVYNKLVFAMLFLREFNFAHNEQLAAIENIKECETLEEYEAAADELSSKKYTSTTFSLSDVVSKFKGSSDASKKRMFLEAITNTGLSDDEMIRLLALHKDKNGIAYSLNSIGNIAVTEIIPLALETLLACSKLDCDLSLMTKEELDTIGDNRIGIKTEASEILAASPDIGTGELIAIAAKRLVARFTK